MKKLWGAFALSLFSACAWEPLLPEGQQLVALEGVDTSIDIRSIQFHSRRAEFRDPVGPVPVGQNVRFRIKVRRGDLSAATLVVQDKFVEGNQTSIFWSDLASMEMTRVPLDENWDSWEASFAPTYAGALGYYFLLDKGGDRVALGNNRNKVEVPWVDVVGTGGKGFITEEADAIPFGLTAYTPAAMEGPPQDVVYYYIFPDRFRNGNRANDPRPGHTRFYDDKTVEFHSNWATPKPFRPGDGRSDPEWNNDFYGGDLEGIIEKLDHIQALGTTMIYMTPIFLAPSNHKYDTADYKTIDPAFGDMALFRRLVREARARGMGIMLDASLNHSGADSLYMDRFGKFPGIGAFENETIRTDSPFYTWYEFVPGARTPDQAYQQWANPTLANLAETDGWKDFAFRAPDSVSKFWLREGAAGWRMDVVPWVSDEFWAEWRAEVKKAFPEALLVSETWFEASKYLHGSMFDGTMNYVFRGATLAYASGGSPLLMREAMEMMVELYPVEALRRSMSLISSHDVSRAMYNLGYREVGGPGFDAARPRFLLAVALQYLLPGAPTVFYGDEVGTTGGNDPFCRGPFPWPDAGADWGDWTLYDEFKRLAEFRKTHRSAIVFGSLEFLDTPGLLTFVRRGADGKAILVSMNNTELPVELVHSELSETATVAPLSYRVWELNQP